MNLKRFARLFGLICILASGLLACSISGVPFIAQVQPTATTQRVTRSARATFTPRPKATATREPSPTEEPTDEPSPTPVPVTQVPTATRKPVVKATARPPQPTNPPQPQPTQPPPAPKFPYSLISHTCEHSGGVHIFIVVYANYKDPGSQAAGIRVIASYAPDSPAFGDVVGVTNGDGAFDYVMSADGQNPWKGTVFAWVVDKNNTRISDVGGPVELNGKNEDAPDTCWIAKFYFAGGK